MVPDLTTRIVSIVDVSYWIDIQSIFMVKAVSFHSEYYGIPIMR